MDVKVRPVSVGPILGATDGSSARIWGRGVWEMTDSGPRRCFGVARLRPSSSSHYRQPVFFKMNPNFDMTGVVLLDDLEAERSYDYQMGYFFSELDLSGLSADYPLDWSGIEHISFRSGAEDPSRARSLVFGSCRYLLRLFGGSWFDQRGDKTFRSILRQIDQGLQTDLVLMLGDQIYADDLGFLAPDQTLDEYNARYRDAFSQPFIRELMSHIPTYMTLDDHEIEDAWPENATPRDMVVKYPAAIHAYQTYQSSHNPLLPMVAANHMVGVPQKFWYTFRDGCCDFFVTDVRTERTLSDDPLQCLIMSDEQLDALRSWLVDGSGLIKFVVTSVPFFPDPVSESDRKDKWSGSPTQRGQVLDVIRDHDVPKVVFLGGDYHRSLTSEVVSPGKPDFRVLSVVSSAFYWPYPHGKWIGYQTKGPLTAVSANEYEMVNSSKAVETDNFTRITADPQQLRIEIFSRKGQLLFEKDYIF
ncbi:MAG: alkaline phosphatase D family protein [Candidatus Promineifilaceae bacterium]|nr:alkaline phosphatase D family protein [Candidatus Promineifilaceae bacterium]